MDSQRFKARGKRFAVATPHQAGTRPAIADAPDGVRVPGSVRRAIAKHRDRLDRDPGLRAMLLPAGQPLGENDHLRQPALAASLRAIADLGTDAFYDGPVGARLIGGLRRLGSPLTADDFRRHTSEVLSALTRRYRGHAVLVPPPNSHGFVLPVIRGCIGR